MAIPQMALILSFPPWSAAYDLAVTFLTSSWPLPFVSSHSADISYRFFFSLGYSADDLVSPSDGISSLTASLTGRPFLLVIPAGHEQLVLWPFRRWL